jgi:hypothetical protein
LIVAVHHDHYTDCPRRKTPRVLPNIRLALLAGIARVLDEDVEHLRPGEVLTEAVRGAALNTAPGCRDKAFYGSGVQTSGELLLLGLDSRDDWDSEEIFVDLTVELEDLKNFGIGFGFCKKRGVTFLPKVLASAEEGLWVDISNSTRKILCMAYEDS